MDFLVPHGCHNCHILLFNHHPRRLSGSPIIGALPFIRQPPNQPENNFNKEEKVGREAGDFPAPEKISILKDILARIYKWLLNLKPP
jgi:hypothetical protein